MNANLSPWRSLKTKVTLFTLAIFMLSIWALSLFASRLLQQDMERLLGEQQFSTVSLVASQVDDEMKDRLAALEFTAKEIGENLKGSPSALQAWLEQPRIVQSLFNAGIFISGPDGTTLASVPVAAGRVGVNYMEWDHIAASLKEGKPAIGKPLMGKQLRVPVFAMTVPIRNAEGKVIGAISGVVDLSTPNFLDKLTQIPYGKTGGFLLIAPKYRQIVTATDRKRVMEVLPVAGVNRYVDRNIAGYEGYSVLRNALGEEQLASVKQMPASGWYMLLGTPTAEAFEPVRIMLQRMRLATLLLTLLAGGLTWWILARQFRPLTETANAMVALSKTNQIPSPLAVHTDDEIGQLSDGFNRLIATWTQRESALRKSEQNLAITLNSIGDAVIATDQTGRVTGMNPTAERLSGWSLADGIGRPLSEVFRIVNSVTREPVADPVHLVMLQGQIVGLANHTALLAKGGQEYQIADSAAPIRDADGKIVGVVLVFSDVTEKYTLERGLRLTRFSVNAASDALYWMTSDARIVDANEAGCRYLGYSREELLRLRVSDVDVNYSAQRWPDYFDELSQRGSMTFESEFRAKDGCLFPVEIAANFVVHEGEKFNCAFVRDITERKRAEAKLQLAADVFNHAREGIMVTERDGSIIDVNEAFTLITGYSHAEAVGQNPRILSSGKQDKAFYAAMWSALIESGHWFGETWNRRKNGEVFAVMQTISAVRDETGAVHQFVSLFSDITSLKYHQSQLEHIAHFDALTNLPNRVLLADRLHQAMAQAHRRGQQLAVAYLDLDGFKAINDQHGHDAGDQMLITLSQRMKLALREGDSLARLGGDEFVAVLIDLEDGAAALPLLTRLLAAAAQPVQVGGLILQVSGSVGITLYPQAQDIDADQLLRQADQAMYQAKLAGKNRYQIFDAKQDSSIRGYHESLERIRLAMVQREFVLYYQPKVNMRTGEVIGAEALIRWQHPEKGILAPAVFLPVIENHPLAVAIGEWVIDTALTQIEQWQAAGLDFPVSVNVGARQLQQSDFVDHLRVALLAHPHVSPGGLELEVLETSALEDIGQVSGVIEACAEMGVTFALDDFGTGYSSLTYLKRLHVTTLKIDKSFVRDMLVDPDDLAILKGVIGLAAAFKREVIAEGVETAAHGTVLMKLGCELAQGYGIARPMPADQILTWAAAWKAGPTWIDGLEQPAVE